MIKSKKQKLIKALKTFKVSNIAKHYVYFEYGPEKQQLYCFNGWMYHVLYPKQKFKTLMKKSDNTMSRSLTEDLLQTANIAHYEYTQGSIGFKTAIKQIIKDINSS